MPLWFGDVFSGHGTGAGSSGGGGDIKTAVVRVAMNTSTGNQAITGAGFTPKAAIFLLANATTDGVERENNMLSFGVSDGTNQWAQSYIDDDGEATTASRRIYVNDKVICRISGIASVVTEAGFVSFDSDGVTVNITTAPGAAVLLHVIFFGGNDFQGNCGTLATTGAASDSVSGLSYQPDLAIFCTGGNNSLDSALPVGSGYGQFTLAWTDGTKIGSYRFADQHNQAAADLSTDFHNDQISINNVAAGFTVALNADGFTLTDVGTVSNNIRVGWFTFDCGDRSVWMDFLDIPTGTGNNATTGVGFEPQLVVMLPTTHDTLNVNETDGTGEAFAIGAFTPSAEYCMALYSVDGADPTDANSYSDDRALVVRESAANVYAADFVSMDADGFTLNYTAVDSQSPSRTFKALAFAIEKVAA